MKRDGKRLVTILTIAVVLLFLSGVGSIAAYLVLSHGGERPFQVPVGSMTHWVPAGAVDDLLALQTLAGRDALDVIDGSLAQGNVDTALSIAANSLSLSDRERAGVLLRMAGVYRQLGRHDLAAGIYGKAALIAILSPSLADVTRVEILSQAADGYYTLGARETSLTILDDAAALVVADGGLKPAQRRLMRDNLMAQYERSGAARSEMARQLRQDPAPSGSGQPASSSPIPLDGAIALYITRLPAFDEAVIRREAAAGALMQFRETHPEELPPQLVHDLTEALAEEEGAIARLAAESTLSRLDKAYLVLTWHNTKSIIARGLYGFSIAPAWEESLPEVEREYAAAWRELWEAREESIQSWNSNGDSRLWQAADQQLNLLSAKVLAGELGLIPDFDSLQAATELQTAWLNRQGMMPVRGWYVDVLIVDGRPAYRIRLP